MRNYYSTFLVFLFSITIFVSINAQVHLSPDFETDLDGNTAIDLYGYGWEIVNYGDEQGQIVRSESWSGPTGLYADNRACFKWIDLSSATMPYLFWKVAR